MKDVNFWHIFISFRRLFHTTGSEYDKLFLYISSLACRIQKFMLVTDLTICIISRVRWWTHENISHYHHCTSVLSCFHYRTVKLLLSYCPVAIIVLSRFRVFIKIFDVDTCNKFFVLMKQLNTIVLRIIVLLLLLPYKMVKRHFIWFKQYFIHNRSLALHYVSSVNRFCKIRIRLVSS